MKISAETAGASLRRLVRLSLAAALSAALLLTLGCQKLRARDQLNKGVQAYKGMHYEEAIEHFKNAANLDPSLSVAKLYLATAYANQFVPGDTTDANMRNAQLAIDQYKDVLREDPANINSTKGIAYLYLNMKKFDDAKEYYKKAISIDPKDAESYYSVAVVDWTEAYVPRMEKKKALNLKPDEPIKDKKVCAELHDKNWNTVGEGIDMLNKAIELRKDYDDAMAYLNLMYRERADLQCDDPEARQADLKTADDWVDKTMAVKKAKAEKAAQQTPGGIVLDQPQNNNQQQQKPPQQ
jgi:tetratricopeptide (TPR) repeat protein